MNKKFLIPFFALFLLIFIGNVIALSGSLSPSRIEYAGDVGRLFQKTLTIRNTNTFDVNATVSSTISNIVVSETKFKINASSNYSLPFNITIAKEGYDEGKINVRLKGTGVDFLDLATTIVLQGNSGSGSSNNTVNPNPNATIGNGEVFINASFDPATPNAIAGKDLIINARLKNLINEKTNFTITANSYEDYGDLLIIHPQLMSLDYNEEKNSVIHLHIKIMLGEIR